jgi:hypothetical protein
MRFPYIQKILRWQPPANSKKKESKGAISLVSVYLFLIFTTLGFSMLYFTEIHLKISSYKKRSTLLDYSSENGIKHGFSHLLDLLTQQISLPPLSQEEFMQLWAATRNKGPEIVEKLIGQKAPIQIDEEWENLGWTSTTDFSFERIEENENYFETVYRTLILSKGKIKNSKQKRTSSLEASLGIFAGHLPLPLIPFLVDEKLDPQQKKDLKERNDLIFTPLKKNLLPPLIVHSEGNLIPKLASSQLQKALKIRFFNPLNLSNRVLRIALGLEESDEAIPEGVYLIKDDLGLGGIYVQGDLEEMVLAIEEEFQVVSFLSKQGCWILKYSPQRSETIFITPERIHSFDLYPRGIIIVNGKIESLGGGMMEPSGQAVLVTGEEIPSILKGINLTIISSDRITVSSHLIHQGVKWVDKVPYIKDSKSQLNIFATGQDFQTNTKKEGKIVIGEDSPKELKIQASLTASGEGFSIEGKRKEVHILGSLQASDFSSNKNTLQLTFNHGLLESKELIQDAPQTVKPVLFLSFFMPLEWKEF